MNFNRFATIALTILAVSCSKDHKGGAEGSISFSVASDEEVSVVTKGNVSDYTTLPAAGGFTITVKDSDNATVWSGLISDWDETTALNVGSYSVTAAYGAEGTEGFDKPYFAGSANFSIAGAETKSVNIPVALANSIVRINCTDAFKNYFPTYSFSVTTGTGNVIAFAQNETRAAFVDAFKFTIAGTLTNQGGTQSTFSKEYTNLEEKTCYTVTFDVTNVGGVSVTVSFNDTVTTLDLGNIELND